MCRKREDGEIKTERDGERKRGWVEKEREVKLERISAYTMSDIGIVTIYKRMLLMGFTQRIFPFTKFVDKINAAILAQIFFHWHESNSLLLLSLMKT